MLLLNIFINPFSVFLLILNCLFIVIFKKWLGGVGIFYTSLTCLIIFIINNAFILNFNLLTGSFVFLDMGVWLLISDIIDSRLLFCFDNLTTVLSITVAILTIFAQFFGVEYMSRDAFISRLVSLLNLFSTSVLLLFCVYDFFLILIAWELIGLFSFLLVNFYSLTIYTIKSSLKTFIFSRLSDLFIFLSFNLSILLFNTSDLTLIFLKTPFFIYHNFFIFSVSINSIFVLTISISLASVIKAAQFGFHVWLPDAMNAPTPASSLIHSSTLVIMGIYLIIRFSLVFEFSVYTNYFLAVIGSLTIALGSVVAVFQTDIKKLVAYSTISQMGYLVSGCGFCAYEETIVYLIMHALNKAFLFIIVGYTVHFFNSNTDLRQMGGIGIYSFDLTIFFITISFNLMGLPFSSGFYSKEFLLFQILNTDTFSNLIKSFWFISFMFTPFYMTLIVYSVNFKIKFNIFKNYKNINTNSVNHTITIYNVLTKLDNSYVTSKLTVFVLVCFWLLVNNFGDFFFMVVSNLISSNESLYSKNYTNIQYHYSFSLNIINFYSINRIFVFIIFITVVSLKFLLLNYYKNTSNYFTLIVYLDFIFLLLTLLVIL